MATGIGGQKLLQSSFSTLLARVISTCSLLVLRLVVPLAATNTQDIRVTCPLWIPETVFQVDEKDADNVSYGLREVGNGANPLPTRFFFFALFPVLSRPNKAASIRRSSRPTTSSARTRYIAP